ncbi:hypothetical protein ALP75_201827 [Pseudomonas syringae pv. actinidiae]|nr:hypothetical protein ALP75_201827 [Pseudomonas syringae pv. actinidiae]
MTGTAQHPVVQLGNQAVGFGNANEANGRQQAVLRVIPAHQRLQLGDVAGAHVDDRLVVDLQACLFTQGIAQFFLKMQFQAGLGF